MTTVVQHSFDPASEINKLKPQSPLSVGWQRSYACTSAHTHHAQFTLESPKSNCFDLCVGKHMWEAESKLKTISKEVKRKGKSKLKASYKQAKSKLEASSKLAKSKITARWKQAKSKPKTCEKQAKSKLKASCQRKLVTLLHCPR